eukprot:SAG31_NODE_376_length_16541_cov_4.520922_3_plen_190_part_00
MRPGLRDSDRPSEARWRVIHSRVAIRAGPSTDALIIGVAHEGAEVESYGQTEGWILLTPASAPRQAGMEACMLLDGHQVNAIIFCTEFGRLRQMCAGTVNVIGVDALGRLGFADSCFSDSHHSHAGTGNLRGSRATMATVSWHRTAALLTRHDCCAKRTISSEYASKVKSLQRQIQRVVAGSTCQASRC